MTPMRLITLVHQKKHNSKSRWASMPTTTNALQTLNNRRLVYRFPFVCTNKGKTKNLLFNTLVANPWPLAPPCTTEPWSERRACRLLSPCFLAGTRGTSHHTNNRGGGGRVRSVTMYIYMYNTSNVFARSSAQTDGLEKKREYPAWK